MDKLKMTTPDLTDKNIEQIGVLFPNVITEVLTPSNSPLTGGGQQLSNSKLTGEEEEGDQTLFLSPPVKGDLGGYANPEALNQRGFVQYNLDLKDRAREMRNNPTKAEEKLWDEFLKNRPENYKFTRQKPLGNFIADFYCSEKLLIIEVDGKIHEKQIEYDKERNDYLIACGITVLRFTNENILNNIESVKKEIELFLKSPCQGGFRGLNKEVELRGLDTGFRVYKTDSTNMKDVFYHPSELKQDQVEMFISNIKEDRTPEDLLTQVILDLGLELTLPIETKILRPSSGTAGNTVFIVQTNALVACFDKDIDFKIVDTISDLKPLKVVFKDASFKDDKDRINVEERFKRLSPETRVTVI